MALGLLAFGIVENYASKWEQEKESQSTRVDFLCERKNQIIYCMAPRLRLSHASTNLSLPSLTDSIHLHRC